MPWTSSKKSMYLFIFVIILCSAAFFRFTTDSNASVPRLVLPNLFRTQEQINTIFDNKTFGNTLTLHKYCDDHVISHAAPGSENERELIRFRKSLSKWPISYPKSAVVILIQNSLNRLKWLKRLLLQYENNFVAKFRNYPIILFHAGDFPTESKKKIRSWSKVLEIYFYQVAFRYPNCFIIQEHVVPKATCSGHTIGYRHMCRFMMLKLYHQDIMLEVEYYWRLDTDSELPATATYDVFKKMRDENLLYAYNSRTVDSPACIVGLRESTERYVNVNNIQPTFLSKWGRSDMFYNNFEVSKMSFWTSVEVQNYLRYIDVLGGVYYIRWGDAPIKSLAVAIFMDPKKVRQFKEIAYRHGRYDVKGITV